MEALNTKQQLGLRTHLEDLVGARAVREADQLEPESLTKRDRLGVQAWSLTLQKLRTRADYIPEMERALLHSIPARDAAVFCRTMLDERFLIDAQEASWPAPVKSKTEETPDE